MSLYLGIEIGGTKLQLVLGDTRPSERRKLAVDPQRGAQGIRDQIERALPELLQHADVKAVGIGFGGPVDWRTGRICRSHQIEGWSEFDLAGWIQHQTGLPVFVDNDANLGALGEARQGAGVGFSPVFYVTLGSGVGGGLVVDGRVYHGTSPGESEIGHIRLDREGTIVESRCSGWAVDARIRDLKRTDPQSLLAQVQSPGGEARHLRSALDHGDAAARRLLHEVADDLGFALSHVVHLFHPEIIILGGGLVGVGEPLRAEVQQRLHTYAMEAFRPRLQVALAALGEDAVPVGALELARAASA